MEQLITIVPTLGNMDKFSITEDFSITSSGVGYASPIERNKKKDNFWHLCIRKSSLHFGTESAAKIAPYNVLDFIYRKYHISYRERPGAPWQTIPNPHLKNVSIGAYAVSQTGLWYMINDTLFYLDAKTGSNTKVDRLENVTHIQLTVDGKLSVEQCINIKKTVQNRYEHYWNSTIEDYFDDYIDEYEVTFKRVVVDAVKRLASKKAPSPSPKAPVAQPTKTVSNRDTTMGDSWNWDSINSDAWNWSDESSADTWDRESTSSKGNRWAERNIPSTDTMDHFSFKDCQKQPKGAYGKITKKEKKLWTLVVDKPCYRFEDDANQMRLDYNVMDFILHNYQVLYRKTESENYAPVGNNVYLKDGVSAYAVGSEGFWYIQKNYFCYLNKTTSRNAVKGRIANVVEIEILPNGKIRLYQVADIKKVDHNRFYSRQMGDFEGYEDEYEITLKTLIYDPDEHPSRL